MANDFNDIDQAAQQLMDSTDPEQLRKFFINYPVEETSVEGAPDTAAPSPVRNIDPDDYTLPRSTEELAAEVDFDMIADNTAKAQAAVLTAEEAQALAANLKAYFASEEFRQWFNAQIADEPFTKLSQRFAELSLRIRERKISYDHLFAFEDLHAALLRSSIITAKLPSSLLPEKLVKIAKNNMKLVLRAPLSLRRWRMLSGLIELLLDYAATARNFHSDSERNWKAAYLLTMQAMSGPWAKINCVGKAFSKKDADCLVELISTAYYDLFADLAVTDRCLRMWGGK